MGLFGDVVGEPQVVVTILGNSQWLIKSNDILAIAGSSGGNEVLIAEDVAVLGVVKLGSCDVGHAGSSSGSELQAADGDRILVTTNFELELLHHVVL